MNTQAPTIHGLTPSAYLTAGVETDTQEGAAQAAEAFAAEVAALDADAPGYGQALKVPMLLVLIDQIMQEADRAQWADFLDGVQSIIAAASTPEH